VKNKIINKKYNVLKKISESGFSTEKEILSLKLDDLENIPNLSLNEIKIIVNLKKSIRDKKFIDYLNSETYVYK